MSADDPRAGVPETSDQLELMRLRVFVGLAESVLSDWGKTLRFALLLSIPLIGAVISLVNIDRSRLFWLGTIPTAICVYALTKVVRFVRREIGKRSPRRY